MQPARGLGVFFLIFLGGVFRLKAEHWLRDLGDVIFILHGIYETL